MDIRTDITETYKEMEGESKRKDLSKAMSDALAQIAKMIESNEGFDVDAMLCDFSKSTVKALIKRGYLKVSKAILTQGEEVIGNNAFQRKRGSGWHTRRFSYVNVYVNIK